MGQMPDPEPTDPATSIPSSRLRSADSTGLRALVDESRKRVSARQTRANELLEKYHDRPLLDVGLRIYQRDRESAGTIVGSALAFRLFLFFVPLLLSVVGLFGFLASWTGPDDVNDAAGVTGTLAEQINTALTQPTSTRWIATFAGLTGMAWAGRSLSKVMVTAACLAWRLPVTTKASLRVIGVGRWVDRRDRPRGVDRQPHPLRARLRRGESLVRRRPCCLRRRMDGDVHAAAPGDHRPRRPIAWRRARRRHPLRHAGRQPALPPGQLGRASQLYGAIGTTIVTLGWFFFLGRAMILGMSLDAVIYERFGSISPVRLLPTGSAGAAPEVAVDPRVLRYQGVGVSRR